MDTIKLRFLIAILIVGGFLGLSGVIIVSTIFFGYPQNNAIEVFEEVAKVMAGFIGLIIGYYFTQGPDTSSAGNAQAPPTEAEAPAPDADASPVPAEEPAPATG